MKYAVNFTSMQYMVACGSERVKVSENDNWHYTEVAVKVLGRSA